MSSLTRTTASVMVAGVMFVAVSGTSTEAVAGGWNGKWNAPLVVGGIAGLAVGAMVASHPAPPPPPPPAVAPAPVYVDEYAPPMCHWVRQPLYDGYGQYAGSRPVRVCD
jgi:hypothetical protein